MLKYIKIAFLIFFLSACTNKTIKKEIDIIDKFEMQEPFVYKYKEKLFFEIQSKEKKDAFIMEADIKVADSIQNGSIDFSYLNIIEKHRDKQSLEYIPVIDGEIWEKASNKSFENFLGDTKNKAYLFTKYYYELAVYKDDEERIQIIELSQLNRDKIEILGRITMDTLEKINSNLIEELRKNIDSEKNKFIFPLLRSDEYNQAFIYLDLEKNKVIYIFYPSQAKGIQANYPLYLLKNTLGLINNPFTVMGRFAYWLYNSAYLIVGPNINNSLINVPELNQDKNMDLDDFEKYLDKISSSPSYKGNIDVLIDGEEFFFSLINSIYKAEKNINFRTYIFDNDDYAVRIADLLKERSEEIEVKVLMDYLGSITASQTLPETHMPNDFIMPKRIYRYLKKDSRIKVRTAKNPWFTTDHVKTLIFDDEEAYIGGMNIGREYRYEWHDMMLKVEGPIVGKLNKDFYSAWAHAGLGGDIAYLFSNLFRSDDNNMEDKEEYINIRPLYTKTGKTEIHNATLEAIRRAENYIYIQNAYFTDNRIINELIKARERGVDVRVILPYWGNHNIMNAGNMLTANALIRNSIGVYMYPKMTHVKATIIDGWAMVGTANYDKLSMRVNQEVNLAFSDERVVNELLIRLFEEDFNKSMKVKGEFPIPWYNHILDKIANQL